MRYSVHPNLFSSVECLKLSNIPQAWHPSMPRGRSYNSTSKVTDIRVVDTNDELNGILIPKLIKLGFSSLPKDVVFNKYKAGDVFLPHEDRVKGIEEVQDRLMTAVVQLNEDYEGGILNVRENSVYKGTGTLALFDSGLTHNVTKIERGIRQTLTIWFTKDNLTPNKNSI